MEVEGPKSNASWILVNLECSGYYRQVYISSYFLNFFYNFDFIFFFIKKSVNYNQRNWELLSNQLSRNFSVIPIMTRSQLIDDLFTLGHAKFISYEVALKLISYLGDSDEESSVRKIAGDHVARIQQIIFED